MKFKKLLAGVCAMSIAASMMAVSASADDAAASQGLEYPTYAPLTLDVRDPATIGPKTLNYSLFAFDGIDSDLVSVDVTIAPADESIGNAWGNGWFGGDIVLSYNAFVDDAEATSWVQHEFAADGDSDISKGFAANAENGAGTGAYSFTYEIPENEKIVFAGEDEEGNIISGGMFQVSSWWGSFNVIELQELTFNFADGTEIAVISSDATTPLPTIMDGVDETAEKPYANAAYILTDETIANMQKITRQINADKALKELQAAYDDMGIDVGEVVAGAEAAAEALGNTTAAVNNVTDAIQKVNGLKDILAKAQAAFDALKEGDVADTAAFEKAKADVEKAAADLDAAKKELDDAIAAYDKETAEEKAKLEQQIADLEAEKAKLEAELEAAKKDAAANADKIKDLEAQIAAKDKEIEELKKNPPAASGSEGGSQGSTSNGDNPGTGVTAGLTLAGLALAGAAVVASKKRK